MEVMFRLEARTTGQIFLIVRKGCQDTSAKSWAVWSAEKVVYVAYLTKFVSNVLFQAHISAQWSR
jgi:hypothetical protein